MREQFEKLPEIKSRLEFCYWSDEDNCYRSRVAKEFAVYLNGAWYTYQEQQKKIDKAIEYLDSIEGLVWYEQIKDILK